MTLSREAITFWSLIGLVVFEEIRIFRLRRERDCRFRRRLLLAAAWLRQIAAQADARAAWLRARADARKGGRSADFR